MVKSNWPTPENKEIIRLSATTNNNRFWSVVKKRAENGVKNGQQEYTNDIKYSY